MKPPTYHEPFTSAIPRTTGKAAVSRARVHVGPAEFHCRRNSQIHEGYILALGAGSSDLLPSERGVNAPAADGVEVHHT